MKPSLLFIACLLISMTAASAPITEPNIQISTPQRDAAAIAALSLGIPPTSQVELNLNAAINTDPSSDSLSTPASQSVPEPTTAIFIGSDICFFIISRLRKREEIFDYYNK